MTRIVALLTASLLSGCFGLMVETTSDEVIASPVPAKGVRLLHLQEDRWACHASWDAAPSAKQGDYLEAWGDPVRKAATDKGEIWIYEGRQWCGFWVFALVPVPFMLPACKTFDHVEFEGDVAVRSVSRRITSSGGGIAAVPNPMTLLFPLPFRIKPGLATDGKPETYLTAGGSNQGAPCVPFQTEIEP